MLDPHPMHGIRTDSLLFVGTALDSDIRVGIGVDDPTHDVRFQVDERAAHKNKRGYDHDGRFRSLQGPCSSGRRA